MKGIFHPDRWGDWEFSELSQEELRELDPVEDRNYLVYILLNTDFLNTEAGRQKWLMQWLGISEMPEVRENPEDPSDDVYEEYFVLREQVAREPDAEVLKEAAYEAPMEMARFAFCYLTKYSYHAPGNDAYSYRTYECGWKEGMTTEDVVAFCQEMIDVEGPFVDEARSVLADPPRDHNDSDSVRMVSHEREMSGSPYMRKRRLAPFLGPGEYDEIRRDVLWMEFEGHVSADVGDFGEAASFFDGMGNRAERLWECTQRWEALDDYARCCIAKAEVFDDAPEAEKAVEILKRLIWERRGEPEEAEYREQLEQAEAAYIKAVRKTAERKGFYDEE